MKDIVPGRYSGLALLAALSVIFFACSIFIPYGFPWMGLGGWVWPSWLRAGRGSARRGRSRVSRATSKPSLWRRDGCDLSLLSGPEAEALARAERARNLTACRTRRGYCDRSRLTPS